MKITKHRNGLELGWNNWFWIRDGKEVIGDYRATVSAKNFPFKQISFYNVHIKTPAQQLIWQIADSEDPSKVTLSKLARNWLTKNVGEFGPDWYAREEPFDIFFVSIVFRRRRDALAFIRWVNECIELGKEED